MSIRFLGGDTGNGGSPRLYQDGDDYLVQGYAVTEPWLLAELNVPDGEGRGACTTVALEVPGQRHR
jgi:hypothetical protein